MCASPCALGRCPSLITPSSMPLNYSKWDQLELSDDSDIEGHPNVDHKSLVRCADHVVPPKWPANARSPTAGSSATSTRSGRCGT
jgi:hypothetical protein